MASGNDHMSNAHKRTNLGNEKYYNSKTLSDIKIRYGENGERVFHSHKYLLSSKSHWFEAAFTGQFQESEAEEITLHDDDPAEVENMLYYFYHDRMQYTDFESEDINCVLVYLKIYQVANKYACPDLESAAVSGFNAAFYTHVHALPKSPAVAQYIGLCDVIRSVYELTPSLMETMVTTIINHPDTQFLDDPGKLSPLVIKATEDIPDFGRDVLKKLLKMNSVENDVKLGFMDEVKCINCDAKWWLPRIQSFFGHCWECGRE